MAQGYYRTPGVSYDLKTGQSKPFTGDCRIRRVDILEDVGESPSPIIDRGQIEGGFLQGLGCLVMEELLWTHDGSVATNSASTYKLFSWPELPDEFRATFLERAAEPGVIFGSKVVDSPATPERVYWAIQRARAEQPEIAEPVAEAVRI